MMHLNPLVLVGAVIGVITALLVAAYAAVKDKKTAMGFERNMEDGEIMRRLARYARPYLSKFLIVGVLMLFSIAYDIISPLIVGRIEELVAGEFELRALFLGVSVYAGVLVFSMGSTYLQAVILQRVGQRIISDLREDLFSHIESLAHEQLNEIPVGKLVTRVTNDTNAISMMFTNLLVNLTKNAFVILGILAAMLCLNYALTLMVLCFVPFILLFTVIFRKFSRRAYRKVKDATTDINTYLSENLSGIKVTQIFGREDEKMAEFREKSQTLSRVTQEQIFVFGVFRPLVYMLYICSILCLFYLGGMGHLNGVSFMGQTITGGTIVTFYMYISKFFTPIQNLAEQFNWLQSALASSEKVFSLMDIEPKMVDAPDAIELDEVRGEIEFRDVWFSYIPGEWVLQGVSFHVDPRQTVAFVGSTGSGKSTILSLICRNYEFQRGEILIDGIDIRKIKISSLRRHFGQMLQDVFLFSGTIRSNIVLREEGIPDEEILRVCRYVNADKFIARLDHGLDEEVRERGNNFSAGQRQLLSFARTILHKPSVMILDEATANIDTETEILIQDSLEKMRTVGKNRQCVKETLSCVQHRQSGGGDLLHGNGLTGVILVLVLIIILLVEIQATVLVVVQDGAAALGALLVNTHIGQVVNRVAVGQVDPFVIQREVVVMIMTAEGAVRATQLLHRLKQLIRVDTAVHHFAALTGQAVTVLHILRIFIIILHILGPGQAVLLHGKMEKDGSGHHFFQFCIGLLLGSRQSLGRVLVPFCQIQYHILVPIDLILVDIIVQPTNTQNIAVNIRVTVQCNQSACDHAVTVDNIDNLVAHAVHIFRTGLQQAVLVLLAAVKVRQLLARVIACLLYTSPSPRD